MKGPIPFALWSALATDIVSGSFAGTPVCANGPRRLSRFLRRRSLTSNDSLTRPMIVNFYSAQ